MSQSTNLLLQGHEAQILTLKYNQVGSILASSGMERNIFIWSPSQSYENTALLKSHTSAVISLAFSINDNLFAASADKTVSAWDVEYQKLLRKYKGHNAIVHGVSTPQKRLDMFVSVSDDNTARIWDQRSKNEIWVCKTKYPLVSCAINQYSQKAFVGGIDNQIKVLNIAQQRIEQVIQGHQDTIASLQLSPDGNFLMSNSFDQTVKIWDIRPNTPSNQRYYKSLTGHLQGNEKGLLRGAWSHDGLYISCGSVDKCVYIWDTNTRKIVQKLGGHSGTVNQVDMSFMNGKNYLASCSNDRNILVSELPDIFL